MPDGLTSTDALSLDWHPQENSHFVQNRTANEYNKHHRAHALTNMLDEPDIATEPVTCTEQANVAEQEHFRLLDLPPELVIRVLRFAVVISTREKPLRIQRKSKEPWAVAHHGDDSLSAKQPAIARTCRLLRDEGLKLFYARNIFLGASDFLSIPVLWQWVDVIGQKHLQRIDWLFIEWVDGDGSGVLEYHDGKILDSDLEMTVGFFLAEHDYLETYRIQSTVRQPYFFGLIGGKLALDVAHGDPRYRIAFKDTSGDGSCWVADMAIEAHDNFREESGVNFWAAIEEG
ncbi:hypothetical protein BST61_g2041 [Cercospora zeina]